MKRIRVLLVDDSRTVLERLRGIIDADPRLEVVAAVETAEEALSMLGGLCPDVISMDIRLPGMNGFEATQRIMSEKPTPIVVVSSSVASDELNISMNALRAGALSVVEKPTGTTHADYARLAERLCTQLAIMSEIRLVRQRSRATVPTSPPPVTNLRPGPFRVAGIGASTGGPSALARILTDLGSGLGLPILLVQHIHATFLMGFVEWLNGQTVLEVVVARPQEVPVVGKIYVAPADHHLCLEGTRLHLSREPEADGQRPSATTLFYSMARSLGPQGLGVLLTGMGADGADGLLALRRAGGYTLAEDATTAVVYGMPAEAHQRGAVCEMLPLHAIGARMIELVTTQGVRS